MVQYINKTALVAEIERRIKEHHSGYLVCLKDILSFLDTIEVKEIDLEKEINKYISDNFFGSETMGFFANRTKEEPNGIDIVLCAKHFFELGMCNKAQKGELTNVFKYVVKMCDRLINNGNYEADAYTQDTVEDISELCNRILDGDYGKLVEVKEVQEEPVSEELEDFAKRQADEFAEREYEGGSYDRGCLSKGYYWGCKAGAKWKAENLWKPADGDDLPKIGREVIALLDNGKVVYAHRPPECWDGKNIDTGKVTRYYPKTYGNGGWNIPNIKWWLDYPLPSN